MTALAQTIRGIAAPWAPLIELTKPRLSLLVLFTTFAGYAGGIEARPDPLALIHVLIGTALVAGGANAINQIVERDHDGRMVRTRGRPLPSGRLGLLPAVRFAVLISTAGLLELTLDVNLLTALLGALALGIYIFLYTPLKRITVHNTLVGAVVGAIPPMMGWTAARGELGTGGWTLCAILFFWQLPHFFSIAWIYRDDYIRGGYRMLCVIDETGRMTRLQIGVLAVLLIPVGLLPSVLGITGTLYASVATGMGVAFACCCLWLRPERQLAHARHSFLASLVYLPGLLIVYLADKL